MPQISKVQTNNSSTSKLQQHQQLSFQLQQQQQLNQELQQKLNNLESDQQPPKKQYQKKAKTQVTEELVEVVSIEYVVNSSKHPNYHLNGYIDRYPIDDIEGFGQDFQREDVSLPEFLTNV